jgi:hypothetical protein
MSQTIENNPKGGPRTAAGKAASSRNSFKHGLASNQILIEDENPAAFYGLVADLEADYQPATETEALLVHDLAKFHWLADRAIRLQAAAFDACAFPEMPASLNVLIRYQTTNQRAFQSTLKSLQALQKERVNAERTSSPPSEQTEARSKTQRTSSPPSEQTEARSKTQRTSSPPSEQTEARSKTQRTSSPPSEQTEARSKTQRTSSPPSEQTDAGSKTQRTQEFVSQTPVQAEEQEEDFTSGPPEGWVDGRELQRRYYAEMDALEAEERKQADILYREKLKAEYLAQNPQPETPTPAQ